MKLPIIFIHNGYSEYMEYTLHQAKQTNPDSKIILLGNEANNRFDFVIHANIGDYFEQSKEFAKIYKHYSSNPYNYELFCIQRWFILKEYMERNNLEQCFVCDTDVMIYTNIDEAYRPFADYPVSLLHFYKNHCLAISFLRLDILNDFCDYIVERYNDAECLIEYEKFYQRQIKDDGVGGVSDMTLVEDWLETKPEGFYANLTKVVNDTTIDSHLGLSSQEVGDEYKFHRGRKNITWKNDKPFGYSYKYKKDILFNMLHFQGPDKYLTASFYTGDSFPGKLRLDIKFFFANLAAYWYKTLRIRYRFNWLFDIIFKMKKNS